MNPRPPLVTGLYRRLRALERAFPAALDGEVDGLHHTRVASRRVREALPVLGAVLPAGKLRKTTRRMRRITRALGPVRELDVELALLAEVERAHPAHRIAIEQVRQQVLRAREGVREEMLERLESIKVGKLIRKLKSVPEALDDQPSALVWDGWWAAIAGRVTRRADRLQQAIEEAGAIYLPDRLHVVRVAVKKLRYGLELMREMSRSRASADIKVLKTVQDTLGRLHDLEVLIDRARALQGSFEPPDLSVLADLDTLVRPLEDECRQLHARYVARRPALLRVCESARRTAPSVVKDAEEAVHHGAGR